MKKNAVPRWPETTKERRCRREKKLGRGGQKGGQGGEGSWCCRPEVSQTLETLQVPLAAIGGDR